MAAETSWHRYGTKLSACVNGSCMETSACDGQVRACADSDVTDTDPGVPGHVLGPLKTAVAGEGVSTSTGGARPWHHDHRCGGTLSCRCSPEKLVIFAQKRHQSCSGAGKCSHDRNNGHQLAQGLALRRQPVLFLTYLLTY